MNFEPRRQHKQRCSPEPQRTQEQTQAQTSSSGNTSETIFTMCRTLCYLLLVFTQRKNMKGDTKGMKGAWPLSLIWVLGMEN